MKFLKSPIFLVFVALSVILLIGITLLSKTGNVVNQSKGFLVSKENTFDFGTISMANGKVSKKFALKNQSLYAVKIVKVYTSCACTEAWIEKSDGQKFGPFGMPGHGVPRFINEKFEKDESLSLEVVFDPAAHGHEGVGKIERKIFIDTNSTQTPRLEFTISANVTM